MKTSHLQPRPHLPLRAGAAAVIAALSIASAPHAFSQTVPAAAPAAVPAAAPSAASVPAPAADAAAPAPVADDNVATLDNVTVTSRNREEIAQNVPVPVSVVSGATLERDNVVGISGLTQKVPNLGLFGSNPRQTSISIRGIGKNAANDTMEPSVGVIVDGVASTYVGQNWTDWVDLDRVEVIRGPQGTLLGKNTTLGVVNITTKSPSFTPGYVYEARVGSNNNLEGKFSATGPISDGVLAYRGSFFINKKDGMLANTWQSGPETWNESNRVGGRLQFLFTPNKELSARIILDQIQSTENGNKSLLVDNGPANFADGPARTTTFASRLARSYFNNSDGTAYRPVFGNDQIEDAVARPQRTKQSGISAEINQQLGDYNLTSITAYRDQHFDIKNGGVTRFDIADGGQQLWNKQLSEELRLSSPLGGKVDYQVGLYALKAEVYSDDPTAFGADAGAFNASNAQYNALSAPQYRGLLRASQDGVYRSYVLEPKTTSVALFGQANWHVNDKTTLTVGLRETHEKKTGRNRRELDRNGSALTNDTGTDNSRASSYGLNLANPADLAAWNAAKALYTNAIGGAGGVYDWKEGDAISANSLSWLVSPSYKISDKVMLYASASQGEKSGAVEFVTANGPLLGTPQNVAPEKARDYELGIKSLLLGRSLLFNVNVYQTTVTDYQANLTVEDSTSTTGLRTYLGNIPGVRARGIELELNYAATRNLKLNSNASFNRATYLDFPTTAPDTSTPRFSNFAGRQLHGAPKVIVNLGVDYSHPVGKYAGRVFLNESYRSGSYLAASLSENTYQKAYSLVDGGVSLATADGKYEFSVVGKNLLNKRYATGAATFGGSGAITTQPGYDRTLAAVFRAKL